MWVSKWLEKTLLWLLTNTNSLSYDINTQGERKKNRKRNDTKKNNNWNYWKCGQIIYMYKQKTKKTVLFAEYFYAKT